MLSITIDFAYRIDSNLKLIIEGFDSITLKFVVDFYINVFKHKSVNESIQSKSILLTENQT